MDIKASDFYKVTPENHPESTIEKEFAEMMNQYAKYYEKNNIEPKIKKVEKIDDAYFALHDYIDWFNHRKDNI